MFYIDPESDDILRYTTASLTKMTRMVNRFCDGEGITPACPGYPSDLPPALETLARYKILIENCSSGVEEDPATYLSAKYMFDMAEVIGRKLDWLPVYMSSPLTFGGENVKTVMEFHKRLDGVSVSSMPSFGASTPLSISGAFATVLAENLGGAILINALTDIPARFGVQIFPFDFHSLNISFGSPEYFIYELLTNEFNARLRNGRFKASSANMHTWAKRPGAQASFEKGSLMTAGAMLGATNFSGLGALSLDEIFSPAQLLLDVEMMKHVGKMANGVDVDPMPADLIGIVGRGVRDGFLGSDLTLDHYKDYMWHSEYFDRGSLSKWRASGEKDAVSEARSGARAMMGREPMFSREPGELREIGKIFAKALDEAV
jgi:trimethylamine:corrinoid methyltransferase-like protein